MKTIEEFLGFELGEDEIITGETLWECTGNRGADDE